MSVMVTYAVRLEPVTPLAVLDAQLHAAGLRQHSGPGPHWEHYQAARAVLVGLIGTPQAEGLTYTAGMHYITDWLGC